MTYKSTKKWRCFPRRKNTSIAVSRNLYRRKYTALIDDTYSYIDRYGLMDLGLYEKERNTVHRRRRTLR
jgi:hypothetical protein